MNGLGHKLSLQTNWSGDAQTAEAQYQIPGFRRDDQALRLHLRLAKESLDAFDSTSAGAGVSLERRLNEQWTVGAGLRLRVAREEQQRLEESYHLLSLPAYCVRSTVGNPLNPESGMKLDVRLEPFFEVTDPGGSFLKGSVNLSRYFDLARGGDWVIATRIKIGSILGTGLDGIPPDERFYTGGGGSIRGYAYNTVSPLKDNDPIGGRSLVELSLEARRRITKNIGIALFVDGGNAFSTAFPDFSEELRWGAGIGVRYFTPVGPLRVDLAVPLNRRAGVDDQFGVYVSFGQAF
jgi:translocation and assembly module TamA